MHSKKDTVQSSVEALRYPWENHPGPDQVVEVMPGVLWVRLKLPFRLNHPCVLNKATLVFRLARRRGGR